MVSRLESESCQQGAKGEIKVANSSKCILCGQETFGTINNPYNITIAKCEGCGLMYQYPRPSKELIEHLYEDEEYFESYMDERGAFQKKFFRYRFDALLKHKQAGRVLDVGAASANFVSVACERGWDAYALELSQVVAEHAKQILNAEILNCTIEETSFERNFFDVVHVSYVLEHMYNPISSLKKVRTWLKPDGLVIIEVPNEGNMRIRAQIANIFRGERRIPNLHGVSPHSYFFTKQTLCKILQVSGFTVNDIMIKGLGEPWRLRAMVRNWSWKTKILEPVLKIGLDVKLALGFFVLSIGVPR